jgi:hypothetical protein
VAARSSSLPEMKGVQLDVGRVDMTLCKNASNGNMHVCFSRSAIVAGTESASHGLARASARRGRRFFKTNVTAALNRTKEGSLLGIEISTSFPAKRGRRRSSKALALATRKRGHAYSNAPRDHSLGAHFCLSPFSGQSPEVCAGTGRNVLSCALFRMQRRRKLRTWTSTRLDGFGFHQDPQQDGVECLGISGRRS